jgi:hypothetical protein
MAGLNVSPGYYQDSHGAMRWWDGQHWTHHVIPPRPVPHPVSRPQPAMPPQPLTQPQPAIDVHVSGPQRPMYVSGLSTCEHIVHGILTLCTFGVWGLVWALRAFLGRNRIR